MARAILFDVDGTLVDSVDLHARAWQEAFARFGKRIGYAEIRSQIGKGGDQLIPVFLDEQERARDGEALDEYRSKLFRRAYLPHVRPLPGARDLVQRVKQAGLAVGLATSSKEEELEHHLDLVGIRDLVDAATTSDDVERSKPHPDVFVACARKLQVPPGAAIAVGDSPYDALSARRAGAPTVGLLAGGFPRSSLEQAGCIAVYEGPLDLLLSFESSPLASPAAHAAP